MYVGLIIVINSFENEILKDNYITSLNTLKEVKICLVCNNSNDQVFDMLTEVADKCSNTNVVNNKRKKSKNSSIRAGARFMNSKFNLKHLGYITGLNDFEILEKIKLFIINQDSIIDHKIEEQQNKPTKQTFFQSIFSISESLVKIQANSII